MLNRGLNALSSFRVYSQSYDGDLQWTLPSRDDRILNHSLSIRNVYFRDLLDTFLNIFFLLIIRRIYKRKSFNSCKYEPLYLRLNTMKRLQYIQLYYMWYYNRLH